jgi:glyceraldehyde 3-phosphate dehydrogenase
MGDNKLINVGINGFGRIGRAILRINQKHKQFNIVAINDINPDVKNICYTIQYDTTYGKFEENIDHNGDTIFIGKQTISVFHKTNINDVPWDDYEVDIVIDSSGIRSNLDLMQNMQTSVKNFIVTNAPTDYPEIQTAIFGVNEDELNPDKHRIISSSICDTIALSPILKLIRKTHNIESGFLTTLHPWLSYQNLLDGPSASWSQPGDINSHYALGRASTENLIPKSTSAILAAEMVFPGLSKVIQSFSYRTPTKIVSSAVMILMLGEKMDVEQLKAKFYDYQNSQKYKVFNNSVEPLTSLDYAGEEYSAIIDHRWTKIENERHLKIVYWYDNEWGYSSRVVDLVNVIMEKRSH